MSEVKGKLGKIERLNRDSDFVQSRAAKTDELLYGNISPRLCIKSGEDRASE
jgi:hypothetical protein